MAKEFHPVFSADEGRGWPPVHPAFVVEDGPYSLKPTDLALRSAADLECEATRTAIIDATHWSLERCDQVLDCVTSGIEDGLLFNCESRRPPDGGAETRPPRSSHTSVANPGPSC